MIVDSKRVRILCYGDSNTWARDPILLKRQQIDASNDVRARAKAVAYDSGLSLTDFVLLALSKEGDKKLTALVEKDIWSKSQGKELFSL